MKIAMGIPQRIRIIRPEPIYLVQFDELDILETNDKRIKRNRGKRHSQLKITGKRYRGA